MAFRAAGSFLQRLDKSARCQQRLDIPFLRKLNFAFDGRDAYFALADECLSEISGIEDDEPESVILVLSSGTISSAHLDCSCPD